jgi:hypothetical protein
MRVVQTSFIIQYIAKSCRDEMIIPLSKVTTSVPDTTTVLYYLFFSFEAVMLLHSETSIQISCHYLS